MEKHAIAGAQGWRSEIVLLYLQFLVHLEICESPEMLIPRDVCEFTCA